MLHSAVVCFLDSMEKLKGMEEVKMKNYVYIEIIQQSGDV